MQGRGARGGGQHRAGGIAPAAERNGGKHVAHEAGGTVLRGDEGKGYGPAVFVYGKALREPVAHGAGAVNVALLVCRGEFFFPAQQAVYRHKAVGRQRAHVPGRRRQFPRGPQQTQPRIGRAPRRKVHRAVAVVENRVRHFSGGVFGAPEAALGHGFAVEKQKGIHLRAGDPARAEFQRLADLFAPRRFKERTGLHSRNTRPLFPQGRASRRDRAGRTRKKRNGCICRAG